MQLRAPAATGPARLRGGMTAVLPLDHLLVLDLTAFRAGPTAVRQLSDWGARVITVERPPQDESGGGNALGARLGSDFQNLRRNNESLTLDLKHPDGRSLFLQLVGRADVVVENFAPGVTARLGLDWPALQAVNPRLVYASISGFGQEGPWALRPGYDQVAQGMSGLMSVTGPARAGAGALGSCRGRQLRRRLPGLRHPRRPDPSGPQRRGCLGADLAARGDGGDAGLPGGPGPHRGRRSRPAGQSPPDRRAHGHLPGRRRGVQPGAGDQRPLAGRVRRAGPRRMGGRRALRPPRRPGQAAGRGQRR